MWGRLKLSKHLEYLGSVLLVDANPSVRNFDLQLVLAGAIIETTSMNRYRPVEREFKGVSYQVNQYLLHSLDVDDQVFGDWIIEMELKIDVFFVRLKLKYFDQLMQMLSNIHLSFIFRELSITESKQIKKIID